MQNLKVKWNVNPATVQRLTSSYIKSSLRKVEENLTFFSEIASEYIYKEAILRGSSTGTAWHRNANAIRGNEFGARIDTGQMAKNVGFLPADAIEDGQSTSEFGLFTGGEDYFMRQEFGFKMQMKNGYGNVPGMRSAEKAIKYTKPIFRKRMLYDGFLRGKVDTRGTRVLQLMSGVNKFGESVGPVGFDTAWKATSPIKSDAAKDAYLSMLRRAKDRQALSAFNDLKWSNNRRVIDSLSSGRDYAQEIYKQTSEQTNRAKRNLGL